MIKYVFIVHTMERNFLSLMLTRLRNSWLAKYVSIKVTGC